MSPLDEPARVARLATLLDSDRDEWSTTLDNGALARLVAGVSARDDCAVISLPGVDLVVGSDYVRGAGFSMYEQGQMSFYDIGYYLVVANLSDVAAMGSRPTGVLVVIRYPQDLPDDAFDDVMRGADEAARRYGTRIIGGDSGTADQLYVSGTALGLSEPGTALMRSGARPGDHLFVSGETGIAEAARRYFEHVAAGGARLTADVEHTLGESWRRPRAEVDLGLQLAGSGVVTSCQDTSDGLKATVEQIAEASGVGFDVDAGNVRVSPLVDQVARVTGRSAEDLVFGGSVDFRLLFTVDGSTTTVADVQARFTDVMHLGSATVGGETRLVRHDGSTSPIPGVAWRHV
ncbi:thiamine-phosphate kinase [Promicromonospora sukumoe]